MHKIDLQKFMSTLAFDTHAFVKAFVNAKNDEERAEILAKTIAETRDESVVKIDKKFDKAKDELSTKKDLKEMELLFRRDIESMKVDMIKWTVAIMGGQLALFVLILKFFCNGVGGI